MNENSNDRTSFQEGEPNRPEAEDRADDGGRAEAISPLDRAVETIKAYEYYGLAAGVVIQLLVLFGMVFMGAARWAGGF